MPTLYPHVQRKQNRTDQVKTRKMNEPRTPKGRSVDCKNTRARVGRREASIYRGPSMYVCMYLSHFETACSTRMFAYFLFLRRRSQRLLGRRKACVARTPDPQRGSGARAITHPVWLFLVFFLSQPRRRGSTSTFIKISTNETPTPYARPTY